MECSWVLLLRGEGVGRGMWDLAVEFTATPWWCISLGPGALGSYGWENTTGVHLPKMRLKYFCEKIKNLPIFS